jgi:peptidyl-prolyl cis-trans isomerase B (cyclophilin B)
VSAAEKIRRAQLRRFEARQVLHAHVATRRKRDQLVWSSAALVAIVVSSLALWGYTTIGPGTPPSAPDASLSENRQWSGEMVFDAAALEITLEGELAPKAVANFISLADEGFYEGLVCHRLTTEGLYVMQCGDPLGIGLGGPGYFFGPVENDPSDRTYPAGAIAMARGAGDGSSMGSQFFVVYEESIIPSDAAGGYTIMGHVTSGLEDFINAYVLDGTIDDSTDGPPATVPTMESITIR